MYFTAAQEDQNLQAAKVEVGHGVVKEVDFQVIGSNNVKCKEKETPVELTPCTILFVAKMTMTMMM